MSIVEELEWIYFVLDDVASNCLYYTLQNAKVDEVQTTLESVINENKQKEEDQALALKSQFDSIQILVSEKTELESKVDKLQNELQNSIGKNLSS